MERVHFSGVVSLLAVSFAAATAGAAPIPVKVTEGSKGYPGDLYLPKRATRSVPLVVVVHEWWGKTQYPEMRAEKLADELGYAALAVDLYGNGQTASTPQEAQELAGPFYQDPMMGVKLLQKFIEAAPAAARQAHVQIDTSRIAAVGYCFGGTQVLNLARSGRMPAGDKLLGVVSFHGGLASSLKAQGPIGPKLLVLQGGADKLVKPEEVAAFKEEMRKDDAHLEFHAYPGALHAFTNPEATEIGRKYGIPIAYDAKADRDSWKRMKVFLNGLFE